jgi:hypothetical protein
VTLLCSIAFCLLALPNSLSLRLMTLHSMTLCLVDCSVLNGSLFDGSYLLPVLDDYSILCLLTLCLLVKLLCVTLCLRTVFVDSGFGETVFDLMTVLLTDSVLADSVFDDSVYVCVW